MKYIKLIFLSLIISVFSAGAFAADTGTAGTTTTNSNILSATASDIGDFGSWATDTNRDKVTTGLAHDIDGFTGDFAKRISDKNFVPIEARVANVMIGGMSWIGDALNNSLFAFIRIFILIMFAFWTGLSAWSLIRSGGDAKKTAVDVAKVAIWTTIWFIILDNNPAQLLMYLLSPILAIGSAISDIILNAVAHAAGAALPDTCTAIHTFMATHSSATLISPDAAATMICVPTRLSGFFYTAIAAGFAWMRAGVSHSAMTFAVGVVFVVIFAINLWKFALQALGIILSLFLAIILLPFTALAELFGKMKKPEGTGFFGDIYDAFAALFQNTQSLSAVIQKFVHAVVYFVILALVAAIGLALLSQTMTFDLAADVPTITNTDFITVLIVGCLVSYLSRKAGDMAKSFGAALDSDGDKFAKQIGSDVSGAWKGTVGKVKEWRKVFKKK